MDVCLLITRERASRLWWYSPCSSRTHRDGFRHQKLGGGSWVGGQKICIFRFLLDSLPCATAGWLSTGHWTGYRWTHRCRRTIHGHGRGKRWCWRACVRTHGYGMAGERQRRSYVCNTGWASNTTGVISLDIGSCGFGFGLTIFFWSLQ